MDFLIVLVCLLAVIISVSIILAKIADKRTAKARKYLFTEAEAKAAYDRQCQETD